MPGERNGNSSTMRNKSCKNRFTMDMSNFLNLSLNPVCVLVDCLLNFFFFFTIVTHNYLELIKFKILIILFKMQLVR